MIDLKPYDTALRNGISAYKIADKAQCSPQTVYNYMRKEKIKRDLRHRQGNRLHGGYRKPNRFNYLKWLRGVIKKYGIEGAIERYAPGL